MTLLLSKTLALLFLALAAKAQPQTFTIETLWNGAAITDTDGKAVVTFDGDGQGNLKVQVDGKFYNSPKLPDHLPDQCPQRSISNLFNYEVIEVFLMNDQEEYVELEFSPRGQYLVLLLKGQDGAYGEEILNSLPLETSVVNDCESHVGCDKRWTVTSVIPRSYLPFNVTKFNAFAIHGAIEGEESPAFENLVFSALYPVDPDIVESPNFHTLDVFGPIDLTPFGVDTSDSNELWDDALGERDYRFSFAFKDTVECESISDYDSRVDLWNQRSTNVTQVNIEIIDSTFAFPSDVAGLSSGYSEDLTADMASAWISFTGPEGQLRIGMSPFGSWNVYQTDSEGSRINCPEEDNVVGNVNCGYQDELGKWSCTFNVVKRFMPANMTHFQAIHAHKDLVDNVDRQFVSTNCPGSGSSQDLDWVGCQVDYRMFSVPMTNRDVCSSASIIGYTSIHAFMLLFIHSLLT